MTVALIILASLIAVGLPLYLHHRWQDRRAISKGEAVQEAVEPQQECCGMHMTCEKDSLLAAASKEIDYYDDEELDTFRGRAADEYTEAETEQFRDILITMLPDDIAGWARSLQLRGITMPEIIKEELLMIVTEERNNRKSSAK